MEPQEQLTLLTNLKAYLGVKTANDDSSLTAIIGRVSRFANNYCARRFSLTDYTDEVYDGPRVGGSRLFLRNFPIVSISSLVVDGVAIPAGSLNKPGAVNLSGYLFSDEYIDLVGYSFSENPNSVIVSYLAGYGTSETDTVPATPFTITPTTGGTWIGDRGVVYSSSGTALTKVASNPAAGEYAVSNGVYTFAAGDTAQVVTISYSYVEPALENAVLELCGYVYRKAGRLGQKSVSLASETTAFDLQGLPDQIKQMLDPYIRVTTGY